jgi:hypothetical protein
MRGRCGTCSGWHRRRSTTTGSDERWTPAPKLDHIVGSVGAAAIAGFGLDVARVHWDMTSISPHGDYEQPHEAFATPKFGHVSAQVLAAQRLDRAARVDYVV